MNHLAITFLYILMRSILKSLLDDVVSVSVLEGSIGKLVKMLVGIGFCSMTVTGSTASKQASCRTVCLHKPALSLSLLTGQKQREKRSDGVMLWTQVCVFSHSSWHVPCPYKKNSPNRTHLVIQTVFKISSADK